MTVALTVAVTLAAMLGLPLVFDRIERRITSVRLVPLHDDQEEGL